MGLGDWSGITITRAGDMRHAPTSRVLVVTSVVTSLSDADAETAHLSSSEVEAVMPACAASLTAENRSKSDRLTCGRLESAVASPTSPAGAARSLHDSHLSSPPCELEVVASAPQAGTGEPATVGLSRPRPLVRQ